MGRPAGTTGPYKPDEEKMNIPVRFGVTRNERDLIGKRSFELGLSISEYFRTLFVADIKKNA